MKDITRGIHTPYRRSDAYDALQMPLYHTLAFEFADAHQMADAFCGRTDAPDYSRVTNPTVIHLEDRVAALTGASQVSAYASGMAAISAMLMSTARTGANVVSSRHLFGNTYLLLTQTLARFGVEARLVDLCDPQAVEAAVDENSCCIFLESVTNPQTEVADVRALSAIAHSHGIPVIADTTMIPFTQFDGQALGLDFQVVSSTKYLGSGGTALGGLIIDYGHFPQISHLIKKDAIFNLGGYMSPHAAYMHTLGLETLPVRYERQAANALAIARLLEQTPGVKGVGYPGLESHPHHDIFVQQYGPQASAMVTFELADEQQCFAFINALKLVHRATNLFDTRSLAIHPASTIFGTLRAEQRAAMDVLPTTIRLSIGLEDVDDIYADLRQAIATATER